MSTYCAAGGNRPDLLDAVATDADILLVEVDGWVTVAGDQAESVAEPEPVGGGGDRVPRVGAGAAPRHGSDGGPIRGLLRAGLPPAVDNAAPGGCAACRSFFIRVDPAGNVSKRFSAAGFPFARFGGSCPRWVAPTIRSGCCGRTPRCRGPARLQRGCSKSPATITGISAMPSCRAASTLAWPAIRPPSSPTSAGLV